MTEASKLRKLDNIAILLSIDGRLECLKRNFKKEDKSITFNVPKDLGKIGWSDEDIDKFMEDNLITTMEWKKHNNDRPANICKITKELGYVSQLKEHKLRTWSF